MSEEDREVATNDTSEVSTLTRSQKRRAARAQRSSETQVPRASRAVTTIAEEDEDVFEEEFSGDAEPGRGVVSSRKTKGKNRSGFVPPTQVSGPRSGDKSIAGKTKSSDRKAKVSRSSGFVPPTSVSGRRPAKKSDEKNRGVNAGGITTTSEYVPPTQVASPRSKRTKKSADGKAKPNDGKANSVSSSGFVPPTRMSGPRAADKGISMASAIDENAIQTTSSGFVPPTHVSGPRSGDKAISGKNAKTSEGKKANSTSSSGFVPPTRVSGSRSADKTLDEKAYPARKARGSMASNTDSGSIRSLETGDDAVAPPSTSAPPVSRSVDILPGVFSTGQPSNIEMDESVSMYTEATGHSAATTRVRNLTGRDDQSIHTTASMATAHVRNARVNSRISSNAPQELVGRSNSGSSETVDSTDTTQDHGGIGRPSRRAASGVRGDRRPMSMMMNQQGHTMSDEEVRALWERTGNCIECGAMQTHKKERYGPFGTLRRMKPLTVEGQCYEGYCLRCHDVHDLRRLLNDYNIPLDLPRHDPAQQSLRALQTRDEEVMELAGKRSPVGKLCSSVRFQICMGVLLVGIAGALVGLGITLSEGPEPWVPPAPTVAPSEEPSTSNPTASPTSYEWSVVSEFRRDYVESFGHHVGLSSDGQTLAVASPKYDGSRGRLDVYRDLGLGTEWLEVGDAVVGREPGDELGSSMSLSGDGSTVAVGSPERDEGQVHVFFVDKELGLVPKGQIILGPTPLSQFGYDIVLNYSGDRLFVSAPQFAESIDEVFGMVQAFDFDGQQWVQAGSDIIGPNSESRFGNSISTDDSGSRVVIGAPLDDEKWEDAGQIYWYELRDGKWFDFLSNRLYGSEEHSLMGAHVNINSNGIVVLTGSNDRFEEKFPNAGVVSIWGIDKTFLDVNLVGFPISGTYENARLGYDMDIADSGELIIVSGQNSVERAGSVRVFVLHLGKYLPYGQELFGPNLGEKDWFGSGPSVSVAARHLRVAIGYEHILNDDGMSHPTVRIYDYYSVGDYSDASS